MSTNQNKKGNRPSGSNYKNQDYTAQRNVDSQQAEFNAYHSRITYSSYYFGGNIFDLYTPEDLAAIVKDPMGNNEILRHISLMLYGTNGAYTNTVDYMCALPTLDRVLVTYGTSEQKRRKNKELMESTLRTIRDKEIMRDALFKGMVEGAAYYYFDVTKRTQSNKKTMSDYEVDSIVEINDLGINAAIISLPADYTKIVGIRNSSYVIAFNLDYFSDFQEADVSKALRKFPEEIRNAYNNKVSAKSADNWVVLDNSKTIVHKIKSKRDEAYGRPLVLAAINDILYYDYFTDTKRHVLDDVNNLIIYETFPEGKDKGTSALTKAQQEKQHETIKSAVLNKNSRGGKSFFSVAAGTKLDTIDTKNTDIFDEKNEANLNDKIALSLGFASSALNGVGSGSYSSQQTNIELVSSQVFQWMDQISAELNKCISENIIKDNKNRVECKYLPITHVNKKGMVSYAKELYLQGKGSLTLWASACGISPDVFFALLDQELADDLENKYPVHKTSYVLSAKDTGRPETDNPTDNTMRSRANNGNATLTPSDKN